jgi:hypothetical protein
MNRLLIEYFNDKFINNIALSATSFCEKLVTHLESQLYQTYYKYQSSHIIFIESFLSEEKYQFIEEFGKQIKIYIYRDQITDNYNKCKYIKGIISKQKFVTTHKLITIPVMVNNEVFKPNNDIIKNNDIICFLDNLSSLPDELNNSLYPAKELPIKMFNNANIIHPQNLGLVSEINKADLLQKSKYYLAITDDYVAEAWSCNCTVLCIEDLDNLQPSKFKYPSFFQSYSNFLKVLLSEKK